jgi:predicted dehydrogenase
MDMTRRRILEGAALAVGAQATRVLGANDRINIAVVGVGGRGTSHLREYMNIPDCHVAAVVDVDQSSQERAVALVEKAKGHKPKVYSDMRQAYADKDLNAVSIATPNHWHVLSALWAVQAGKDVYVEKPVSHNIFEGQVLTAAARKYNRIVQVGQQSRSTPHKMRAAQLLSEGIIGKVYLAKGLCFKRRKSIGKKPDGPVPAGVDWDLFLGPAPMRAFNENRFKYNWHWFWDTGNGDIGNQGVHEMDIALWGAGKMSLPKAVTSTGGKYVYDDDQETPNTQFASFDYGDSEIQFEVRGIFTGPEGELKRRGANTVGNLFLGSDGYMSLDENGFQVYKGENHELAMDEKNDRKGPSTTQLHMENFVKAVKSRDYKDLHCDVETAARAAALCHLANISYRLGRRLSFDPATQKFIQDDAANEMLTRAYRAPYVVERA